MAIDPFEQALQFGTLANRNRNQANLESAKQKLEQATSTLNVE
jgi:hypothetical protein